MLKLSNISKSFGENLILSSISFDVKEGEFLTLLGSSGCGKTTTLRIIAGLETSDSGKIFLSGEDISAFPPNKRDVNTVFQNYALFPHMSIEGNIGYSLKLQGLSKESIKEQVSRMLDLVRLSGFEKRMPEQLSGGQKQRVAIARSLIAKPKILLLDEPLGALDLNLRREMQTELKKLQKKLGISFVYITHDQEEALNMSDTIGIMNNGKFEQIDKPSIIYDKPKTAFVAKFVGNANIIKAVASVENSLVKLTTASGTVYVQKRDFPVNNGDEISIAIRSELVELDTTQNSGLKAVVREKSFNSGMLRITAKLLYDDMDIVASRHGINSNLQIGDEVCVNFDSSSAVIVEGWNE